MKNSKYQKKMATTEEEKKRDNKGLNREKYENAQKKHERYFVWLNTRTWQE